MRRCVSFVSLSSSFLARIKQVLSKKYNIRFGAFLASLSGLFLVSVNFGQVVPNLQGWFTGIVLRLGTEHDFEADWRTQGSPYQHGRFAQILCYLRNFYCGFCQFTGLFAGLSMLFIRSSAISLYVAEKALEVKKLHTISNRLDCFV